MNTPRKPKPSVLAFALAIGTVLFVIISSIPTLANTPPEASFTVWRSEGKGETVVSFDASSSQDTDGRITRYQWTFGDGTSGSGTTIEHTYPALGSYDVTLLVFDDGGAAQFLTVTIDIAALPSAPTAPNEGQLAPPSDVPVGTSVGERAPEFALPDFNDQIIHLSDFLGKVVLLEFWRSTCPHCIASIPYLEDLRQEFEDQDFVVIMVILDYNPAEAHLFLVQNGYTGFITVRELDPNDRKTAEVYEISMLPRAFLLDKTGVIRYEGSPTGIDKETIASLL